MLTAGTFVVKPRRGGFASEHDVPGPAAEYYASDSARLASAAQSLRVAASQRKTGDPNSHFADGNTTRPGVVVRMLYSMPPPVMYSVFRSSPPNAQFVTSSVGTGRNVSSLPSGSST